MEYLREKPEASRTEIIEASAQKIFEQRLARNRPGDSFSLESVEKDVHMTEQSIKTIEFFGRTLFPGMRVVRCDLEQFAPEDACEFILNHVEAVISARGRGGSSSAAHQV